jgi:pyridoxal 5'-phosphate synthase pdxS subunit
MINDSTGKMATELPIANDNAGSTGQNGSSDSNFAVKAGLARMLQGGVIMDVVNAEQVG